jgi:peptidoglycan/xylan/chitin deacetylase (PgdA/CDA1 family)
VRDRLVLGYHAVSAGSASSLTVGTAALRRQVAHLLGRSYTGTTFSGAVFSAFGTRLLALTFDDGERSVLEQGFPVLAEVGVPGTVFVIVEAVGAPGRLGWDDLETLAAAGWEVGSHTVTHARLTELDDASLDEELRGSREAIERRLRRPCCSIAYPYGAWNAPVRAAAARAGFTAGCTTSGTLSWPRVGVDGRDGDTLFRLKTSTVGRALRGTPVARPVERIARTARAVRSA